MLAAVARQKHHYNQKCMAEPSVQPTQHSGDALLRIGERRKKPEW